MISDYLKESINVNYCFKYLTSPHSDRRRDGLWGAFTWEATSQGPGYWERRANAGERATQEEYDYVRYLMIEYAREKYLIGDDEKYQLTKKLIRKLGTMDHEA